MHTRSKRYLRRHRTRLRAQRRASLKPFQCEDRLAQQIAVGMKNGGPRCQAIRARTTRARTPPCPYAAACHPACSKRVVWGTWSRSLAHQLKAHQLNEINATGLARGRPQDHYLNN